MDPESEGVEEGPIKREGSRAATDLQILIATTKQLFLYIVNM